MSQSTALDSLSLNRPLCICVSQSKNCHESKNDVRNALAAQIRKLEPKNYLESLGRVGSLHNTNGGPPAFLCSRVELSLSVRRLRPSGPTESARASFKPLVHEALGTCTSVVLLLYMEVLLHSTFMFNRNNCTV